VGINKATHTATIVFTLQGNAAFAKDPILHQERVSPSSEDREPLALRLTEQQLKKMNGIVKIVPAEGKIRI